MTAPVLSAEKLGRRVDGQWLLRQAEFALFAGERVAITGPTGAGKSVLLRLLAGLDPPEEGRLLWNGNPLAPHEMPRFRSRVVYCAQAAPLPQGSVEASLRAPFGWRSHRGRRLDEAWLAERMRWLSLTPAFLRQEVESLSGGQRQLAALLRALAVAPEALLLDEPTSALDPDTELQAERVVLDWLEGDSRRALVLVSHQSSQRNRLTRRSCAVERGPFGATLCVAGVNPI